MILIHDAVDRCCEADPITGIVSMHVEGYEIYEHFEKLTVYVISQIEEVERTLQFNLSHDTIDSFVKNFEKYRGNGVAIEARFYHHVRQCISQYSPEQYVQYYHDHQIEMAALRTNVASFVEACRLHGQKVQSDMEMKLVC